MRRRLLLPLLTLALLALPAAAHAASTIATPGGPTQLREFQGTIVFDQRVPATGTDPERYRLAIRRPGGATELLPIAPSESSFQADIGPDSAGRPEVVYRRCEDTCDLFVFSLADPARGERAVRNANDPEHHDVQPTLWRGRIAWARIYGEQRDRKVIVYTKLLKAPRSRPSTRLPGVPERRCGDVERTICGPTSGRSVDELELWGSNLAEVVDYACAGCSGIAQTELRLVRVPARSAQQIAFQVTGLSGQVLVGPSFTGGRLGWYRACLGDPGGCLGDKAAPFRYGISTRAWARGPGGPIAVHGYADTGALLLEVAGCNPETTSSANADCRIDEVPDDGFTKISAPLR